MEFLNLDENKFRKNFISLNNDEKLNIITDPKFYEIDNDLLLFCFNTSDDIIKNYIINDSDLCFKLLKSTFSKLAKINTLDLKYQEMIINKPSIFLKLSNEEFIQILNSMNVDIYKQAIELINNFIYANNIDTNNTLLNDIKIRYNNYKLMKDDKNNNIISRFRIQLIIEYGIKDEKLLNQITNNFCTKKRNFLELCRIETYEQLYIYNRLGIVINKKIFEKEKFDIINISIELIRSLNSKHLIRIMNELKQKGPIDDTKLFITAVKMYCLFGIDNSLKIINDKFTYSTDASLLRASNYHFVNERRKYRFEHPDEFLNYESIEKLKKSIEKNNINYMKKIIIDDTDYLLNMFEELKYNYKLYKDDKKYLNYLRQTIKNEIIVREKFLKRDFQSDFYLKNRKKRNPVTPIELYELFKLFDVLLTQFDGNANVKMDDKLQKFLLGNTKYDNDCLLRIVLNHQGLEYDYELINIINRYNEIINSQKELKTNSLYSLLDILDIYKTLQYKLKLDELDIPLSMMSKTALSKKHLNVSVDEAIDLFKEIYKEHKKKYYSTIPRIKGITKNKYRYKVLDKNDIELITCGIDTGSCFKPGGPGGDFYKYCLTSPYADVIGIKDPEENLYVVPIIRSGNAIYGNGIDPENISDDKIEYIKEALKKCYNEIIKQSNDSEKIDFCTITDLHHYIKSSDSYKKIELDKPRIIGDYFYSDLYKNEINSYVLAGNSEKIKEYIPTYKYYIPRSKNFIYTPEQVENKLIIEQKIDEIEYQNIDYKNISDEEKINLKNNFNKINANNYTYIICNEDWYLAIDDSFEIKSAVLPYDPRAKDEFLTELTKIKTTDKTINKIR